MIDSEFGFRVLASKYRGSLNIELNFELRVEVQLQIQLELEVQRLETPSKIMFVIWNQILNVPDSG